MYDSVLAGVNEVEDCSISCFLIAPGSRRRWLYLVRFLRMQLIRLLLLHGLESVPEG